MMQSYINTLRDEVIDKKIIINFLIKIKNKSAIDVIENSYKEKTAKKFQKKMKKIIITLHTKKND